jgi:hypothetical protein
MGDGPDRDGFARTEPLAGFFMDNVGGPDFRYDANRDPPD